MLILVMSLQELNHICLKKKKSIRAKNFSMWRFKFSKVDPDCVGKKDESIKMNENLCGQLVTSNVLTKKTRFYGPFADVFNEKNSNYDSYQRMKDLFGQLKDGYNVTIFGYGFSGSGKTYTLLGASNTERDMGITQLTIKDLNNVGEKVIV